MMARRRRLAKPRSKRFLYWYMQERRRERQEEATPTEAQQFVDFNGFNFQTVALENFKVQG